MLKAIIVLLALVLVAFGVLLAMGGRIEYTDTGVHLVLPWREKASDRPDQQDDLSAGKPPVFVVEDPEEPEESNDPSSEPTAEPSREPEITPAPPIIGAVEVTDIDLVEGRAAELVAAADGNALVIEMKDSGGRVYWNSETALPGAFADPRGSATDKAEVAAAIKELAEGEGLYLVARFVCFRDQVLAASWEGITLKTKGGNVWYDSKGLRWVSPASEQVRDYMIDLCLELAELGFDEILLDCAGYPWFGETHVLATDERRPEDLYAPVELFWKELKQALAQRGVLLSAVANNSVAYGIDELSGVTPDLLDHYADRVWAESLPGNSPLADRLVTVGGDLSDGNRAEIHTILK